MNVRIDVDSNDTVEYITIDDIEVPKKNFQKVMAALKSLYLWETLMFITSIFGISGGLGLFYALSSIAPWNIVIAVALIATWPVSIIMFLSHKPKLARLARDK